MISISLPLLLRLRKAVQEYRWIRTIDLIILWFWIDHKLGCARGTSRSRIRSFRRGIHAIFIVFYHGILVTALNSELILMMVSTHTRIDDFCVIIQPILLDSIQGDQPRNHMLSLRFRLRFDFCHIARAKSFFWCFFFFDSAWCRMWYSIKHEQVSVASRC